MGPFGWRSAEGGRGRRRVTSRHQVNPWAPPWERQKHRALQMLLEALQSRGGDHIPPQEKKYLEWGLIRVLHGYTASLDETLCLQPKGRPNHGGSYWDS